MSDSDQDPEIVDATAVGADPAPEEADAALEPMGPGQANLTDAADDDEALEDVREGPGLAGTVSLDPEHLMGALESLILVSDKPIAPVRLARLTRQDVGVVRQKLAELVQAYRGRGIVLDEIAGGFQFRTSPKFAPFVRNLVQQKPTKLTRAQLEVLSIIAYRQPVTRPEIEDVRGVDSGSALKVLLERNVIKIIGKKDEAGRPMLYASTPEFLELFGLRSLKDLPTLREFAELSAESRDMFERRIGEPVPGEGMNLETHYTAAPSTDSDDADDVDAAEDGPSPGVAAAGDESATGTPNETETASTDPEPTSGEAPSDEDPGPRDDDADDSDSVPDRGSPVDVA